MKEYKDMTDNEIRESIKKLSEELEERRYSIFIMEMTTV